MRPSRAVRAMLAPLPGTLVSPVSPGRAWPGYNFLYSFKGAPSARHAYGRNRPRELARATGGEQGGRVTGDKRQGLPGVSPLPGGSFRRALRAEALRRDELPRTAAPAPAAAGPRRHAPDAAPHEQGRAVTLAPSAPIAVRKGHSHRAGTLRIVRVGPSSVKGTRRSFLTAPQKRSSGPTLERRRPLPTQRA